MITETWDRESGLVAWRLTVKAFDAQIHYPNNDPRGYDASLPESLQITYKVDGDAHVYVSLPGGRAVYQPNVPAGVEQTVSWDGKDTLGNLMLPGNYTVRIHPVDAFPGGHYESEDTVLAVRVAGTWIPDYAAVKDSFTYAGSPYVFLGSATVNAGPGRGDTLQINPGVKVMFSPLTGSYSKGSLNVLSWSAGGEGHAHLFALGKADSMILFSSYKKPCDRDSGDWARVQFNYNDSVSVMRRCTVEYGGGFYSGGGEYGSINCHSASPLLDSCVVSHSKNWGVYATQGYAKPLIRGCQFSYNDSSGIIVVGNAYPRIEGCQFDHHLKTYIIRMDGGPMPVMTGNAADGTNRFRGVELINMYTGGPWTGRKRVELEPWVPYVVKRTPGTGAFSVTTGDTLVLQPGCVVKLDSATIFNVNGHLRALGRSDSVIAFTSLRDDSLGGDTNGDRDSTRPRRGDWGHVYFGYQDTVSVLDHCQVRFGGYRGYLGGRTMFGSLQLDNASPVIRNSVIEQSGLHGLYATQGYAKPEVTNCRFSSNDSCGVASVSGARTHLVRCSFVRHLSSYPVRFAGTSYPVVRGCTADETNKYRGIELGSLTEISHTEDTTTVWEPWAPYVVKGWFRVWRSCTLWVQPGCVVKFDSASGLLIGGENPNPGYRGWLKAIGRPDSGIAFTSLRDDSLGGDTNGDSDSTAPRPGNWGYLSFTNRDLTSRIEHGVIRFGGGPVDVVGSRRGSIYCASGSPRLIQCVIERSGSDGVFADQMYALPVFTACAFTQNDSCGVRALNGASPVIHSSRIFGNGRWGVYSNTTWDAVDATGNWWGHESGPRDESPGPPDFNPCGLGDRVSDYVSYRPWLGDSGYPTMVSSSDLATAYNNGLKIVRDRGNGLHVVYRSGNSSYYSYSTNGGASWAERGLVGEGVFPALAKDGEDSLYACWIKNARYEECWVDTLSLLNFARRDERGLWSSPCTLAMDFSAFSPQVFYSPPALVVLQDTVRLVYERMQLTQSVPPGTYNVLWKLFFGTFSVHAPQAVRWQVLDTLYLEHVFPPPPTPVSPSINLDFLGKSHVIWEKQGEVYYREQESETGWLPIVNLSFSPDSVSSHPTSFLYGSRLSSLWEEALGTDYSVVYYKSRELGLNWSARLPLSGSLIHSHAPSGAGNAVVAWGEALDTLNSEIYYTVWNDTTWSPPQNLSNTLARSFYPHLTVTPYQNGIASGFLWTEGSLAPYEVAYQELWRPLAPTPWYSADVGQANPSPFTVERDGYEIYGLLPYQTIDYDHQKLVYRFPGLDTTANYKLWLVAYFEKKKGGAAGASDATGPDPDSDGNVTSEVKAEEKIKQYVLLNGEQVGTMELIPGVPDTFVFVIPKALYRSGMIELILDKKNGRFASLAQLALYQWKEGGKEVVQSHGAPQSGEEAVLLPKAYELYQGYPNPARDGATIRYALPKDSKVSLSVYNIAGQLIRRLVNATQKPGYHAVRWDGKDEFGRKVSNGVYLYRIQAGEFAKTRKLVIVR